MEQLHRLAITFFTETGQKGGLNWPHFSSMLRALVASGQGTLFVMEDNEGRLDGAVGGLISRDLFTGDVMVIEMFWYVDPARRGSVQGIRLLHQFIHWAETLENNKKLVMAHLHFAVSEKVEALYTRLRLTKLETLYVKDF